MVRIISRLVINLLLLLSVPAYAGVGSITDFKGAGSIKRAAKTMPAARGSGVEKNDTISTNSQGRFRITFVDSTTVNITENSRLVIDDFVFDGGGKGKGKLGLKVALGTVRYASGGIAKGNPKGVNIRTPTSTIGVRGTDFVMSVDEMGRTMIVLLPNCFDEKDPSKIDETCPTGMIEVTTAAGTVTLSQPFQATVVESSSTPPSTPTTINLSGQQLGNSLQISPPSTTSGVSVVQQARSELKSFTSPATAAADNNAEPDIGGSSDTGSTETVASVSQSQVEAVSVMIDQPVSPIVTTIAEAEQQATKQIYTNVSPVYQKQVQVAWTYSILSPSRSSYATVRQSLEAQTLVSITQDGITDSYNFAGATWPEPGTGNPQGTITIYQSSGSK